MNYSLGIPGSDPNVLWSCMERHLGSQATYNSSNFSMGNEKHYFIILQLLSVKQGHDRSKLVKQSRSRKCSLNVCSSFPTTTTTIIGYITVSLPLLLKLPVLECPVQEAQHTQLMPALLTTNYPFQLLQWFSDCTNKDAIIFNVTP